MNINIFTSLGIILLYICGTTIGRYLLVGLQDEDNKQVTDDEMAGRSRFLSSYPMLCSCIVSPCGCDGTSLKKALEKLRMKNLDGLQDDGSKQATDVEMSGRFAWLSKAMEKMRPEDFDKLKNVVPFFKESLKK